MLKLSGEIGATVWFFLRLWLVAFAFANGLYFWWRWRLFLEFLDVGQEIGAKDVAVNVWRLRPGMAVPLIPNFHQSLTNDIL